MQPVRISKFRELARWSTAEQKVENLEGTPPTGNLNDRSDVYQYATSKVAVGQPYKGRDATNAKSCIKIIGSYSLTLTFDTHSCILSVEEYSISSVYCLKKHFNPLL